MMEQIPDHPVIQSMERTGYPPGHTRLAPWGESRPAAASGRERQDAISAAAPFAARRESRDANGKCGKAFRGTPLPVAEEGRAQFPLQGEPRVADPGAPHGT